MLDFIYRLLNTKSTYGSKNDPANSIDGAHISTVVAAGITKDVGEKRATLKPLATNNPPFDVVALVVAVIARKSSITYGVPGG